MAISFTAPLAVFAAVAAAVAFAPAAFAEDVEEPSRPGTSQRSAKQDVAKYPPRGVTRGVPKAGPQDVPKGWTNEALWSQAGPGANPFGAGPKPPIYALD